MLKRGQQQFFEKQRRIADQIVHERKKAKDQVEKFKQQREEKIKEFNNRRENTKTADEDDEVVVIFNKKQLAASSLAASSDGEEISLLVKLRRQRIEQREKLQTLTEASAGKKRYLLMKQAFASIRDHHLRKANDKHVMISSAELAKEQEELSKQQAVYLRNCGGKFR